MSKSSDYYRNTTTVKNIDPGALWLRKSNTLVLDDDDQFVTAGYDPDLFAPIDHDDPFTGDDLHETIDMT